MDEAVTAMCDLWEESARENLVGLPIETGHILRPVSKVSMSREVLSYRICKACAQGPRSCNAPRMAHDNAATQLHLNKGCVREVHAAVVSGPVTLQAHQRSARTKI